jgi:hypothetical protein
VCVCVCVCVCVEYMSVCMDGMYQAGHQSIPIKIHSQRRATRLNPRTARVDCREQMRESIIQRERERERETEREQGHGQRWLDNTLRGNKASSKPVLNKSVTFKTDAFILTNKHQ